MAARLVLAVAADREVGVLRQRGQQPDRVPGEEPGDFSGIPLNDAARRFGDAWDVANAVVFLASDEARYITATEIVVDGGLIACIP